MAQQSGFLLLADISGYTSFVTQTELEHAEEILTSLIEEVVAQTKTPLTVLEIEGDAIFSYAPDRGFSNGQTLIDMIEKMYAAFAQARAHIHHNTTCTCNACQLAPSLDLKFVIHYGTFTLRKIGKLKGITGQDVILVHRLLKNTIIEDTGVQSYAFFSDAALDVIDIPAFRETLREHAETYDHLGKVCGAVYDMHAFWHVYQEQLRTTVPKEGAWVIDEIDLPVPPVIAWEYLTQSPYRQQWLQAEVNTFNLAQGRMGAGMVEHCVHGKDTTVQEIIDWRPFDYLTYRGKLPLKGIFHFTSRLSATEEGTRATLTVSKPEGKNAFHTFVLRAFFTLLKSKFTREFRASCRRLIELIKSDAAYRQSLFDVDLSDLHVVLDVVES